MSQFLYASGPGVYTIEQDDSTYVPSNSYTSAAFAGRFVWGPVNVVTQIASEEDLRRTFYKPTDACYQDYLTCSTYLSSSINLKVTRVVGQAAKNAVDAGTAIAIYNDIHYQNQVGNFNTVTWAGKYPGTLGNGIAISIGYKADFNDAIDLTVGSVTGTFVLDEVVTAPNGAAGRVVDVAPTNVRIVFDLSTGNEFSASQVITGSTSGATGTISALADVAGWKYAELFNNEPDAGEFHLVTVDTKGYFSTTPGTILEKFQYLSTVPSALYPDGTSAYFRTAVNRISVYIWNCGALADKKDWVLASGVDANEPTPGAIEQAYRTYANPDKIDVSLIIAGEVDVPTANYIITNVAEARADCVAFFSPPMNAVVDNAGNEVRDIKAFRNQLPSTSYGFLDNNWMYVYDQYNDEYRWIPCNAGVAGCAAFTDSTTEQWYSIAGYTRGKIRNAIKLAWNPEKPEIGELYKSGVNSIIAEDGEGIILFGDKTMQTRPSAFDRINVRRLFNVLKTEIRAAAKYSLFEFNDEITRAQFRNLVEPYLRDGSSWYVRLQGCL
jgi:phage tail sheath protein FI